MKCINEFLRTVIAEKLGAEVTEAEDKTAFFTLGVTSLISEEIMTILHNKNLPAFLKRCCLNIRTLRN
ncbi:hypothetical protein [Bacillus velezensis]|uniref:hypothetical protein n=1 Tax=Bacillus velezensis TaxID=492670 RepID=UPI003D7A0451